MTDKINADFILNTLRDWVEDHKVISKSDWLEIAFKLNTFLLDENKRLFQLQQMVAGRKFQIIKEQSKRNVSAAELEVEASDMYREMREQDAKVLQILEFIRIAKKQGDLI